MPTSRLTYPSNHTLFIRGCRSDLTSHPGFKWPEKGFVVAPDFKRDGNCGHGLFGWTDLHDLDNYNDIPDWYDETPRRKRKYLLFTAPTKTIDPVGSRKKKVPAANVIFCGTHSQAVAAFKAARRSPRRSNIDLQKAALETAKKEKDLKKKKLLSDIKAAQVLEERADRARSKAEKQSRKLFETWKPLHQNLADLRQQLKELESP